MASTIGFPSPENALQVYCNLLGYYFMPWAKEVSMHIALEQLEEKFAFIDLAAGIRADAPEQSTSYAILEWVSRQKNIRSQLYTLFKPSTEKEGAWKYCLDNLSRKEDFRFAPQLLSSAIDNSLQQLLASVRSLPTLIVADWCINQDITWEQLQDLVQQHPADCLLWVDYQQLLKWGTRKKDQAQLERTLGAEDSQMLQTAFKKRLSNVEKLKFWKQLLETRLHTVLGTNHPGLLCYTFYDEKDRPSYFLYFLTRNPKAYTAMRQVMNAESQIIEDGIGNLAYQPSQGSRKSIASPTLFGPMFELEQHLLHTYLNQTVQLIDLYEAQHWGRSLTKKNYIDALLNLEEKGQIKITRTRAPRGRSLPKHHLPDKTFLSFKPQQVHL